MTKDDGGNWGNGGNGDDGENGGSRSTQKIISVKQPDTASNKNKAHGYSVNDKRTGTQRIISIAHNNENTLLKDDGVNQKTPRQKTPRQKTPREALVPAIGRSGGSRSRSRSRSTQNKTQGYSLDGSNNNPALKKSNEVHFHFFTFFSDRILLSYFFLCRL